jgi:hypothetical protein
MFALEARITSSLQNPLAFLEPVRYTLEVSLRAGICWKTLARHSRRELSPEQPLEVPPGEIKQLER